MRREFSKEFKRDAVSLVIEQRYSQVDAAKSLGIHSALLSRWSSPKFAVNSHLFSPSS
jgi:transposase-like protein